jgi:predicted enzyme related to lactoylglutathione lyase
MEDVVPLGRLVIYAKDVEATARFYETHFGFRAMQLPGDRIVELVAQDGGANIMLHPAGRGLRSGQAIVKLVFDVEDVEAFCRRSAENGLDFGPIHQADGYAYANAKDPCLNSISISSRAFRRAG